MPLKHFPTPAERARWVLAVPSEERRDCAVAANPSLFTFIENVERNPKAIKTGSVDTVTEAVSYLSTDTLTEALKIEKRDAAQSAISKVLNTRRKQVPDQKEAEANASEVVPGSATVAATTAKLLTRDPRRIAELLNADKTAVLDRYDLSTVFNWVLTASVDTFATVAEPLLARFNDPKRFDVLVRALREALPWLQERDDATRYQPLLNSVTTTIMSSRSSSQVDQIVEALDGQITVHLARALSQPGAFSEGYALLFSQAYPLTNDARTVFQNRNFWHVLMSLRAVTPDELAAELAAVDVDKRESLLKAMIEFLSSPSPNVCRSPGLQSSESLDDDWAELWTPYILALIPVIVECHQQPLPSNVIRYTRSLGRLESAARLLGVKLPESSVDTLIGLADSDVLVRFVTGQFVNTPTSVQLERIAASMSDREHAVWTGYTSPLAEMLKNAEFADHVFNRTENIFVTGTGSRYHYYGGPRTDDVAKFLIGRLHQEVEMTPSRWDQFFALVGTFSGTGKDMADLLKLF